MKENMTINTDIKKRKQLKSKSPIEFDFIDIEKRLKELKELEKKLLSELEKF